MKKVVLSLLALTLMGAGAFAADAAPAPAPALKFTGYLNTGIDADFSSSSTSTYLYGHDENYGNYGSIFKLVGTYDADTWGYKFRLRARPVDYSSTNGSWQQPALLNYVYGYAKPVAGATVFAGKLGDGTIGGLDDEGDIGFFYLEGAEALYTAGNFSVAAAAGKRNPNVTNDGLLTAYAASYSLPKTFTVEGHLTTGYDAWNAPVGYLDTSKVGGYAVTGSLDAIDGLKLTGGYNVYTASASAYTFFDLTAFYTLDKLTFGGKVYDHISANYFDITPKVTYAVTSALSLGAQVEIFTADASTDSLWAGPAGTVTPVGATSIPAVTASYVIGGATTSGYIGYDVANKITKTYLDFAYSF